jgi:hypothetical protein
VREQELHGRHWSEKKWKLEETGKANPKMKSKQKPNEWAPETKVEPSTTLGIL